MCVTMLVGGCVSTNAAVVLKTPKHWSALLLSFFPA
jgi:hypothetical protein